MKKAALIGLLSFICLPIFAVDFRQDIGVYQSNKIWFGTDLRDFAGPNGLDTSASDGTVDTVYTKSTFGFAVSEKTHMSVHLEYVQSTMNGFSAGGAAADDVQSGLSEVGFDFTTNLATTGHWSWDLFYGAGAPGSPYNPFQFNAIGSGSAHYDLGFTASYSSYSLVGFSGSIGYVHRPGHVDIVEGGELSSLSIPDRIVVDLSVPLYFGTHILAFGASHSESLSGIDIGDADWAAFTGVAGQPPFPATRENVTTANFSWAYAMNNCMIDIGISRQISGRNTDQGIGFNFGYSRSY